MDKHDSAVMATYARYPVAFVRGEGCRVWDENGKSYLDFLSGIGVNNLGHCPQAVTKAICEQSQTLMHTSNLYGVPLQEQLAKRLTDGCFADRAFFCNSGAEANEAAIKLARKYMKDCGKPGRFEIITARKSFHGRTMATLSATGQTKVHRGFDPLLPGFKHVGFNNLKAVEKAINGYTAAIMVEPIQGEGGVRVPDEDYLLALREIADRHEILLILDEVQTGMGRTGTLWRHQACGMTPDIMTVAKALASGLPMGACLATDKVAKSFSPGTHASTFGGNPLCCAAALATLDTLEEVLPTVVEKGHHFRARLREVMQRHKLAKAVRGAGMMVAMEMNAPAEEIAAICLSRGLLLNCAVGTVLRFLPPLIATKDEIDEAVAIVDSAITDIY